MKANYKYLIMFLLLLYSCSDNTVSPTKSMSELITKKWRVESAIIKGIFDPIEIGTIFDFHTDSSLILNDENGNVIRNVKWSIDTANKILNIHDQNIPSPEYYFITQLDEKNLKFYFEYLYFKEEYNLVPF